MSVFVHSMLLLVAAGVAGVRAQADTLSAQLCADPALLLALNGSNPDTLLRPSGVGAGETLVPCAWRCRVLRTVALTCRQPCASCAGPMRAARRARCCRSTSRR